MITLRQFVGALLEEVTRARVISDAASVSVAHAYLAHPYLKGFPVPRMHVREVEIEVSFAVASAMIAQFPAEDAQLRTTVRDRLMDFVRGLPRQAQLQAIVAGHPRFERDVAGGIATLQTRFDSALAAAADTRTLCEDLTGIIQRYLTTALASSGGMIADLVAKVTPAGSSNAQLQSLDGYIRGEVQDILTHAVPPATDPSQPGSPLDMKVVVEAGELERLQGSRLQRMKVTFTSSDRKWVTSSTPGAEDTHLLTRN